MRTPKRVMTIGLLLAARLVLGASGNESGSHHPGVTMPGSGLTGGSGTLSWDSHDDPSVKGYQIYCGTASGSYRRPIEAGLNTAVTISNLQRGIRHFFAITLYNTVGESTHSNEGSAVIP